MFCWKNPKQQLKSMVYSKQNLGFSITSTYNSSYFSQNYVSNNVFPIPQIFPLWVILSHIIMIQNQQIFKHSNLTKFPN
jgi:hypothetical protein